jgi:hypothetical protein
MSTKGKKTTNHMENFFECMKDRSDPISDVYTHHNAMTTLPLGQHFNPTWKKAQMESKKRTNHRR